MIEQQEFVARRTALLATCEPNSLIIIAAAQECTRSNDTEYRFRQDSDFWYLTGFNEPNAYLVMSNADGAGFTTCIFVQPSDPTAEIWHGRRLGVESAIATLAVDTACSVEQVAQLLPKMLNGHSHLYYAQYHQSYLDELIREALSVCYRAPKQSMNAPRHQHDIRPALHAMRLIKSEAELDLMQQAADISARAHIRAMQRSQAGVYEYQLQAEIEHEFLQSGAHAPAYASIVGGGSNACILHYTENQDKINNGDLVLIDAGAEFQGYAADITRTFPVNGRFTKAQAELYQLVLDCQLAALGKLKPNNTISQAMDACLVIMVDGLKSLGLLHGDTRTIIENKDYRQYFMHGLGHWLGLDVHDVGDYKQDGADVLLRPGMVMTVEPGLYIAPDADVPEAYRGIGIRIEDDIVISESGNRILTDKVPKTIEQIETLMAGQAET